MDSGLPKRDESKNHKDGDATGNKKKRYWKTVRIGAVFGIIEAISLVFWIKAEDFDQKAAHYIRWIAACGFLAGGAFLAYKFVIGNYQKCKKLAIWVIWGALCISLLFLNSAPNPAPSSDIDGNPTGLLLPASDPIPQWIISKFAFISQFDARFPKIPPPGCTFLIFGSNAVALNWKGSVPAIRFHGRNTLTLSEGLFP